MEPRTTEPDALWRVYEAMDRLLSLLPIGPRAAGALEPLAAVAALLLPPLPPLPPAPAVAPPAPRPEDLAIQEALDEVLEYHRTHRPKNTARNYGPKQKE
ncbi:hypothetical protein BGZ57DRAFT_467903 [Hyaloscypha finlandica]|nr:hypothetical protein BGZ57DRAFT_467903 [Hyaloscypha finlandica]